MKLFIMWDQRRLEKCKKKKKKTIFLRSQQII